MISDDINSLPDQPDYSSEHDADHGIIKRSLKFFLDELAGRLSDATLDSKYKLPAGGTDGQVLTKTATGYEWKTPAAASTQPPTPTPTPTPTVSNPELAFDVPATMSNQKKVLAHYFPPYPLSLDNASPGSDYYETGYLAINGENGKHSAYGGFLRDRPLKVQPGNASTYKVDNIKTEINQAISKHIDGFMVDILVTKANTANAVSAVPQQLLDAAQAVSSTFKIYLMPDMSSKPSPGIGGLTPVQLKTEMMQYANHPSVAKLSDGRLVIAPFYAEIVTPQYWQEFKTAMEAAGQPVAMVYCFLDATQNNQNAYASTAYGFSNWGNRNPLGNPTTATANSPIDLMNKAHAAGKIWMQPVSYEDSRPKSGVYEEAENTTNLRNTWNIAMSGTQPGGAEWVQLVTWNDYSENATFNPSGRKGWAVLDLQEYWLIKYKTGAFPKITRDALYLSHRIQQTSATASGGQTQYMQLRAGGSPARNLIEVVAFLTEPATIRITALNANGTVAGFVDFAGTTGVNIFTTPLANGKIKAEAIRGGVAVQTTTTPFDVVTEPVSQTLNYEISSSRR